jgi:hypothetical protein
MIIIAASGREISRWIKGPQVGLLVYLLIRLITVFDPAFCRVFFCLHSGLWRQANKAFKCRKHSVARTISKEYPVAWAARDHWANHRENST